MLRYNQLATGMMFAFGSLVFATLQMSGAPDPPSTNPSAVWTYLPGNQGWTSKAREKFYYTSQGSEMMPYGWFLAIEQPDSQTLFCENLERFGFLVPPASSKNPDRLPLGFVVDQTDLTFGGVDEKKWVGLTCAACHTSAIDYKKHVGDAAFSTLIVDGGPTLANFGGFINALAPAITQTQRDSEKYGRFEERVLGTNPTLDAKSKLKHSYTQFAAEFERYMESSHTLVPWGRGRVDAFGMIFNRVCSLALNIHQNSVPPNAPVSYPFLWNVERQDHIQWHGEVENINKNPLFTPADRFGRNAGEVMGVFARIDMTDGYGVGYPSSLNLNGLIVLEYEMEKLKAPQWPEGILGKIAQDDASAGKVLYDQYCQACHARITSSNQIVPVRLGQHLSAVSDIGTDQNMTVNVHSRLAMQTGWLEGHKTNIVAGQPFKATTSAQALVGNAVVGALLHLPLAKLDHPLLQPQMQAQFAVSYKTTSQPDLTKIGYEARPLHGIWATSPYLHNGSVPNLWQLLLRAKDRDPKFYVGSREYDTENVGYRSDATSGGELFDTRLDGNHNSGHEYGVNLGQNQRRQLIEYLKTL